MAFKQHLYQILASFGIKLFTKIFPEYFAQEPLAPSDRYLEYSFAIRNLPKPPARVLDVGCSGSFFPLILASFGYKTYGADIRPYPILNKLRFPNFIFKKVDIRKTKFSNNFFAAITAISTIEHIGLSGRYGTDEDPEGDQKALKEMKKILKPEGMILLTLPFGRAKIFRPFHRVYDQRSVKQLVKGFRVEKAEYYQQDAKNNWYRCPRKQAAMVKSTQEHSALCLLKIVKER